MKTVAGALPNMTYNLIHSYAANLSKNALGHEVKRAATPVCGTVVGTRTTANKWPLRLIRRTSETWADVSSTCLYSGAVYATLHAACSTQKVLGKGVF